MSKRDKSYFDWLSSLKKDTVLIIHDDVNDLDDYCKVIEQKPLAVYIELQDRTRKLIPTVSFTCDYTLREVPKVDKKISPVTSSTSEPVSEDKTEEQYYQEGYDAYGTLLVGDCPYSSGNRIAWRYWQKGWLDAWDISKGRKIR